MKIIKCEVCGNSELNDVLDLGLHPMCDDLVEVGSDRVCKEYPILITYCKKCNTAHQRYQIPKGELFPTTYHYRSRFTADVLNGMKTLVEDCDKLFKGLDQKKVMDIGCNDGSLLNFFKESGAITYGIEPTGAYADAEKKGHFIFNEYLTPEVAEKVVNIHGKFDFITFTNVFAHIEDLKSVIIALKVLMHDATVIVIENHYLGAVLDKMQFDTFYHEHPRTYSYTSFTFIAKSLGLEILDAKFPSRYGGNIRITMGRKSVYKIEYKNQALIDKENNYFEELTNMATYIKNWKTKMLSTLKSEVNKNGPLSAKAFPGRAAILVKLLNLDKEMVSETYEKPGSLKIGYYLPGTRIPIKSDEELFKKIESQEVLVNFAWHISDEIEKYLLKQSFKGKIINIL